MLSHLQKRLKRVSCCSTETFCISGCILCLVMSLNTTVKGLAPSFLHPSFKYLQTSVRSHQCLLFSRLSAFPPVRCALAPLITSVTLPWTFSMSTIPFLCWGAQNGRRVAHQGGLQGQHHISPHTETIPPCDVAQNTISLPYHKCTLLSCVQDVLFCPSQAAFPAHNGAWVCSSPAAGVRTSPCWAAGCSWQPTAPACQGPSERHPLLWRTTHFSHVFITNKLWGYTLHHHPGAGWWRYSTGLDPVLTPGVHHELLTLKQTLHSWTSHSRPRHPARFQTTSPSPQSAHAPAACLRILRQILSNSLLTSRQTISTALLSSTRPVASSKKFNQVSQAGIPTGETILSLCEDFLILNVSRDGFEAWLLYHLPTDQGEGDQSGVIWILSFLPFLKKVLIFPLLQSSNMISHFYLTSFNQILEYKNHFC